MNAQLKKHLPLIQSIIAEAQDTIKRQTGVIVVLDVRPHGLLKEDLLRQLFANVISRWHPVTLEDIVDGLSNQEAVSMRKVLCMLSKKQYPDFPLRLTAQVLKLGDHGSVIHHKNTGYDLLQVQDEKFMKYYTPVKDFFL